MVTFVHQCPHCRTENIAFTTRAQSRVQPGDTFGKTWRYFFHLSCPACGLPSAVEAGNPIDPGAIVIDEIWKAPGFVGVRDARKPLGMENWEVREMWPKLPEPRVPQHLPAAVHRAFAAAELTFPKEGLEEASAGAFGRALDVGTKLYAPDLVDLSLYARITKLAELRRITPELAQWAHAIRLIRNEAVHEPEAITRDELIAMRGVTEMILTYLFTLPGMLEARQAEKQS